ncbi:hypothetical protein Tco_0133336 [Tanacetum coccineum]
MDELHVRLNILRLTKTKTKRIAEETLLQESFKKLRTAEASRTQEILEIKLSGLETSQRHIKGPTEDKERALWVELKRLFEPDKDDVLWKYKAYVINLMIRRRSNLIDLIELNQEAEGEKLVSGVQENKIVLNVTVEVEMFPCLPWLWHKYLKCVHNRARNMDTSTTGF